MLALNSDTVRFIIDTSRQFQLRDSLSNDEEPTRIDDDFVLPLDRVEDASRAELFAVIGDLEPDQQIELVALMWLGRGDYALDEWNDAVAQAAGAFNARTAEYLIGTPLLSDYLDEGLALHGYSDD